MAILMATSLGRQQISQAVSSPAPTMGINDTQPLANMENGYCVSLLNFYPSNESLSLRSGYREWVTNITDPDNPNRDLAIVKLITYVGVDGTSKMFATTSVGIWDVSSRTDSPVLVYPLNNGDVSSVIFSNVAGNYLVVVNGVDPAALYDGSTWISFTLVPASPPPSSPGQVAGVDSSTFSFVTAFKGRLWFVQEESMTAWYLGTDAISGIARPFYLGSVFQRGGNIFEICTWSFDSGIGMDDNFVFRSSMGEIAIYQGTDPDSADSFSLVSVYYVSPPIGKLSHADLGGDVIMLTKSGIIPLSKVVQGIATESLYESALSKNISKTLNSIILSANSGNILPWEIHNAPSMQSLVVVLPSTSNSAPVQFVMNCLTGAWCAYDLPASCFGIFNGIPYFGSSDGKVYSHSPTESYLDGVLLDGTGGTAIEGSFLTAFSYLGNPTALKHFKMVRPIFQSLSEPAIQVSIAVDYNLGLTTSYNAPAVRSLGGAFWDEARWSQSVWSTSENVFRPWSTVVGLGYAGALRMRVANINPTNFVAFEVIYENGGVI